jgi:hypothetical protein
MIDCEKGMNKVKAAKAMVSMCHRSSSRAEGVRAAGRAGHEVRAGRQSQNRRLADWGAAALAGSPADFGKLIREEAEKWGNRVPVRLRPDRVERRRPAA